MFLLKHYRRERLSGKVHSSVIIIAVGKRLKWPSLDRNRLFDADLIPSKNGICFARNKVERIKEDELADDYPA